MEAEDYGFANETLFFSAIELDERVSSNFRSFIRQVADDEARKILAKTGRPIAQLDKLVAHGMEPYDRALAIYTARFHSGFPHYPFSQYYRWWARQYIARYIHHIMQDGAVESE